MAAMVFFHPPTTCKHNNPIITNNPLITNSTATATATWTWRQPFQIFTTILLSLLSPVSFLLLARLSAAHYLVSSSSSTPIISSLLFYSTSTSIILYVLVSLVSAVSAAAFLHALTSPAPFDLSLPFPHQLTTDALRTTRLYVAWVVLCIFQACVALGIEGTISAKIDGSGFGNQSNFIIRALLLVGLHETMVFWSNSVVKPVVEDTVLMGSSSSSSFMNSTSISSGSNNYNIRWVAGVERVGMGLSIGALWWWRLREEVDSLVAVPEVMLAAGSGLGIQLDVGGVGGFVGWWLYYLTVSMGTMRAMKAVVWMGRMGMGMGMAASGVVQQLVCKNEAEKKSGKENDPSPPLTPSSSCSLPATNPHHHHQQQPTLEDVV